MVDTLPRIIITTAVGRLREVVQLVEFELHVVWVSAAVVLAMRGFDFVSGANGTVEIGYPPRRDCCVHGPLVCERSPVARERQSLGNLPSAKMLHRKGEDAPQPYNSSRVGISRPLRSLVNR
ncbi:hypothetical protein ETAA8_17680 [Anatilimnocola aggregata]|uniref:Uncharacterized protein n=1 Tax=Anatilimnocola aggregata TaxID=2528021 RepID=A0A517Y8W9_9BACT|nr:hypothetical protein ETAA8_17680 [Anatilimnocola aggregata]